MNVLQRRVHDAYHRNEWIALPLPEIPRRWRWAYYAVHPLRSLVHAHLVFRRWAVLPGDVFEHFQADTYYVVTAVKWNYVEAVPVAGGLVCGSGHPFGPSWAKKVWALRAEGVFVPAQAERCPRRGGFDGGWTPPAVDSWTLPDKERANRARYLVGLA